MQYTYSYTSILLGKISFSLHILQRWNFLIAESDLDKQTIIFVTVPFLVTIYDLRASSVLEITLILSLEIVIVGFIVICLI